MWATAMAFQLKIPFAIVRKEFEENHNQRKVECVPSCLERVLFIDDLISTGRTFERVRTKIKENGGKITAIAVNAEHWSWCPKDLPFFSAIPWLEGLNKSNLEETRWFDSE